MQLLGTRFGDIEIDGEKILLFSEGLPGLQDLKHFTLLTDRESAPFFWLQSIEDPEIALAVVDPFILFPDYAPSVPEDVLQELGVRMPGDVTLLVVCVIPSTPTEMTANLAAPLVIHSYTRAGRQVILESRDYSVRRPIYEAVCEYWRGGDGFAGSHA